MSYLHCSRCDTLFKTDERFMAVNLDVVAGDARETIDQVSFCRTRMESVGDDPSLETTEDTLLPRGGVPKFMHWSRAEREIPDEVEELLAGEPVVAHLATCADGRPHSAPLWYRYEDGVVEILTTGVKLDNIRKNPRVSVSVERDHEGIPEWMVTVRGTATVVEDEDEIREANTRINRKYGVEDDAWSENVLVRIDVGSVSYRTY